MILILRGLGHQNSVVPHDWLLLAYPLNEVVRLVLWLLGGRHVQLGDLLDRGAPTHGLIHLVEEHHLLLVFFIRLTCICICVGVSSSEEVCGELYLWHILRLLLRIHCHKIFTCSNMRQIFYWYQVIESTAHRCSRLNVLGIISSSLLLAESSGLVNLVIFGH